MIQSLSHHTGISFLYLPSQVFSRRADTPKVLSSHSLVPYVPLWLPTASTAFLGYRISPTFTRQARKGRGLNLPLLEQLSISTDGNLCINIPAASVHWSWISEVHIIHWPPEFLRELRVPVAIVDSCVIKHPLCLVSFPCLSHFLISYQSFLKPPTTWST